MLTKRFSHKYFSNLTRSSFYKLLDQSDITNFSSILKPDDIITQNLDNYNTDWRKVHKGNSKIVLKPQSTQQLSKILKYCNSQKLAVVPQSGNTSLVFGSIPV